MNRPHATIHGRWPLFAAALWLCLCAIGLSMVWLHAGAPSALGAPTTIAPSAPSLDPASDRPTLVMFAHPKCPCTRASAAQIARLQARFPHAFALRFVLFEPRGADVSWRGTALEGLLASLQDATIIRDVDGELTRRAGAETSGLVALYSVEGKTLFWGGVTPSRGHEGASDGIDALASILRGEAAPTSRTPVFGCAILPRERGVVR
jgi:hypothetical protein